jgi:tripartite-type tricarboxylate transporter receptor subunit TctC
MPTQSAFTLEVRPMSDCLLRLACAGLAFVAAIVPAAAQNYPEPRRPVTIIVPYAPGGGTDTAARLMAAGLERELSARFQVVNRAGAASQIGLTELARAKPDGMTLAYAILPTVVTHYRDPKRQAPYNRASFQPVVTHYISTMTLSVRGDSPYRSLRDLVEAARAAPGRLTVSDSGLLGTPHTTTLLLQGVTGAKFTAVHFTGGQPSVMALLGGHVDALAGGVSDALPHWRSGRFRVLGIAAEVPDPAMPEVPTMRAQGFDVISASIGMLVAPAGTPRAIVETLAQAARRAVADGDHVAKLTDFGSAVHFHGPDEAAAIWQATEQRLAPLLEQLER